jgi:cyclic-di-GMP phosphodiesterase TipF (flagellum assembly factor)
LRAEGAPAAGGPLPNNAQESRESRVESNGTGKTVSIDPSAIEPAPRAVGNAGLARRFAGPG